MLHTDGFCSNPRRHDPRVLGVHIVGFGAGEMIHEAAVLMEFARRRTSRAPRTMSEAVRQAALATFFKGIELDRLSLRPMRACALSRRGYEKYPCLH